MAQKESGAAEALEEIQGVADRMAEWIQSNLRLVVAAIVGLLVLVGGVSLWSTRQQGEENEGSTELALVRDAYLEAMGASPGALDVPELASPAAAARIREEYTKRFGEVAETHSGTVAGTLARLEVGELSRRAGDSEAALTVWAQALEEAPAGDALRGLVLQRLGQGFEGLDRWAEAAARYEEAADLDGFPLRGWALADAARCYEHAGEGEKALALYDRLEEEMPDLRLPDHLRVQQRELRAAAGR